MSRIAITGSTGTIGRALTASLERDGHTVHRVVRDAAQAGAGDVVWVPEASTIDPAGLEGVDAVVHLAGAPFTRSNGRDEAMRQFRRSRVAGTDLLARVLAELSDPPSVLVSASAVGYYGDRGAEILTEDATPGDDRLAQVCVAWERAADPARAAGIRVVHPRTGVVIAQDAPLVATIRRPFKLGVGGRVGDGKQYVPWIAIDDHVAALRFLLDHELEGPVNLTAPRPVTNAEMTAALGQVLRRPTLFPVPAMAIRALYGGLKAMLATVSQRAVPARLLDAGFRFRHLELQTALEAVLGD